jgi:hypothetical protein
VDGAELSAYSVRALRGRCHLSLPKCQRGAGVMERACRSSCRLLQGCEPARRLSYHLVRLSGFSISSPEGDLEWKGCPWLHARRQSESVDGHQPDRSALVASSSQRQVPAGAGRDVQPCIRGWISYYSNFYKTRLRPTLKRIDAYVIRWARRKFKRMRHQTKGARDWFDRLHRANPQLFAHWPLCHGNGRTSGAV